MRQLMPTPAASVDLDALYRTTERKLPKERSYVVINMVASVDGGTAMGGVSGPLGGSSDKEIFATLRTTVDVILVGRRTIEAEGYGPANLDLEQRKRRIAAGKDEVPAMAVVSQELDLDWGAPFFKEAEPRPFVITSRSCAKEKQTRAKEVAEVLVTGDEHVGLREVLVELRRRGIELVLCEGGPTLNGSLADADLVDELCLTISPSVIGGKSKRIMDGSELEDQNLQLAHLLEDEGFLFLRYTRDSQGGARPDR